MWNTIYVFGFNFLLNTNRYKFTNICPPSKEGIGKRLITPIETDTVEIKYKKVLIPVFRLV